MSVWDEYQTVVVLLSFWVLAGVGIAVLGLAWAASTVVIARFLEWVIARLVGGRS